MRYAVISDIHGNLPALEAVLCDAKDHGFDGYIFAGDYCLSGPYPDQCIELLRSIDNKYIIRGNEERYLENLIDKDQSLWLDGQMQISYWTYKNTSRENVDYLMTLPHRLDLEINGTGIHISHFSSDFIGEKELPVWGSTVIATGGAGEDLTRVKLDDFICGLIDSDAEIRETMDGLADGVYIFGHSHIQWTYKHKDRNIYLLNPGSCGLPLDGITGSIPYAILDISEDGKVDIELKRLPFDMASYVDELKKTSQFSEAKVWSNVIIKELTTAKEHVAFFLEFTSKYADQIGDDRRPFALDTWETAFEKWDRS